jgi:uncharacterized protein
LIAYLDSSLLLRAYLADEEGHDHAVALLNNEEIALVTGTWTRIEVSGALVRAARNDLCKVKDSLLLLDEDLGESGAITVVTAPQVEVEKHTLKLVRSHGLRAMDAWHLAVASIILPALAESDEEMAFASRDIEQIDVAKSLGFQQL